MQTPANRKAIDLAELLGVRPGETIWGRLAMFAAANLSAQLVFTVYMLVDSRGSALPLMFWLNHLLVPVFFSLAAWAALKLLRNAWAAAAVCAAAYAAAITGMRLLLSPRQFRLASVFNSLVWPFLALAGIILALRLVRSLLPALFLGILVSSLLDVVASALIYSLLEKIPFGFPFDWLNLGLQIASAALFALVLWAGLKLSFCRPELLGRGDAAASAPVPGDGGDLQRRFDYLMLRSRLRAGGVGSLVFGVLAIGLGASSMRAVPANGVLALLGVVLIAEGIWVMAAPSAAGLVADGVVLVVIGLWNFIITLSNAASSSGTGHFAALGIMQIVWGIQAMAQYKRFSYLAGARFSTEEMKRLTDEARAIWQADAGEPDLVDFTSKAFWKEIRWRGKLLPGSMIVLRSGKPFFSSLKSQVELKAAPDKLYGDPVKASLRIEKLQLSVSIPRRSLDRLNAWKAQA